MRSIAKQHRAFPAWCEYALDYRGILRRKRLNAHNSGVHGDNGILRDCSVVQQQQLCRRVSKPVSYHISGQAGIEHFGIAGNVAE